MQIRLFVLATSQDGEFTTTLHADETAARAALLDNFGDEIKEWTGEDDLTGMDDDDIDDAIGDAGIDWSIEEHLVDPAMFAQFDPAIRLIVGMDDNGHDVYADDLVSR